MNFILEGIILNMKQMIDRINYLYKKSKEFGLSDEERIEQEKLRKEYVKIIRGNFENQLKNYKKKGEE
ncbi:hypothetical protein RATSFB_0269 [Candidatus Arthromitus sp. SFB-rat-Yit]|nr:hypothetical protein RATSFB_0269 [Candidatus Arthromitus sp. SFB-rat-Yit]